MNKQGVTLEVSMVRDGGWFRRELWWLTCSYPGKPGMNFMVGEFDSSEKAYLALDRLGKVLANCP